MKQVEQYWYVVKQQDDTCKIIACNSQQETPKQKHWGSFTSEQDAIAKRVGLIRAGKCKPV